MSYTVEFGIMETLDINKEYVKYEPQKYNCVEVHADIINGWWARLKTMKSYFHSYGNPATALNEYGITLIPPESLDLFYDIVENNTSGRFLEQVPPLLELIRKAKIENKFIIHFGI